MKSILARILALFSNRPDIGAPTAFAAPQIHKDCTIHALPIREGGQFRLAGRIEKLVDGEPRIREFLRADQFSSLEDALDCTFRKGQQIIDQNGPALFADVSSSRMV